MRNAVSGLHLIQILKHGDDERLCYSPGKEERYIWEGSAMVKLLLSIFVVVLVCGYAKREASWVISRDCRRGLLN